MLPLPELVGGPGEGGGDGELGAAVVAHAGVGGGVPGPLPLLGLRVLRLAGFRS